MNAFEWLEQQKNDCGSFAKLAERLGVNVSYVYDYMVNGVIPSNPAVRHAMHIYTPRERYRHKRAKALNRIAQAAGFASWTNYETEVFRGNITIKERTDDV